MKIGSSRNDNGRTTLLLGRFFLCHRYSRGSDSGVGSSLSRGTSSRNFNRNSIRMNKFSSTTKGSFLLLLCPLFSFLTDRKLLGTTFFTSSFASSTFRSLAHSHFLTFLRLVVLEFLGHALLFSLDGTTTFQFKSLFGIFCQLVSLADINHLLLAQSSGTTDICSSCRCSRCCGGGSSRIDIGRQTHQSR